MGCGNRCDSCKCSSKEEAGQDRLKCRSLLQYKAWAFSPEWSDLYSLACLAAQDLTDRNLGVFWPKTEAALPPPLSLTENMLMGLAQYIVSRQATVRSSQLPYAISVREGFENVAIDADSPRAIALFWLEMTGELSPIRIPGLGWVVDGTVLVTPRERSIFLNRMSQWLNNPGSGEPAASASEVEVTGKISRCVLL